MTNQELKKALVACSTREQGLQIVAGLSLKQLQDFAKFIHLASANKQQLQTRIVERVVGLRLRQDAFASLD